MKEKKGFYLLNFLVISAMVFFIGNVYGRGYISYEDRIKAQEAIERIYYGHRIWPKENGTAKPSFELMIPKETIEKKVEDYLKKSVALERYWRKGISSEQLQAEIERMTRDTRAPEVLKELFKALGDDPYIMAECLARPELADRFIKSWYIWDERFHRDKKE